MKTVHSGTDHWPEVEVTGRRRWNGCFGNSRSQQLQQQTTASVPQDAVAAPHYIWLASSTSPSRGRGTGRTRNGGTEVLPRALSRDGGRPGVEEVEMWKFGDWVDRYAPKRRQTHPKSPPPPLRLWEAGA